MTNKIAFICTTHQSKKHRPNGFDLFNNYLESLYLSCKYPFKLFAFDNASEDKFEIENPSSNLQITYVENQYKGGLTYTWNEGVKQALKENFDLMIITSDDQIIDESINNFIYDILQHPLKDKAVFGPLSNNANNIPQTAIRPNGKIFEITDIPLIDYVARKAKPIIISTGIASLEDIELAIKTCKEAGNNDITILKCTSAYPASPEDAN